MKLNLIFLETFGFQVIDLFNKEEIKYFEKLYKEYCDEEIVFSGLSYSLFNKNIKNKKYIDQEINKIISTKNDFITSEFESFSGSFLNKPPAPESEFYLHQDWSYTDENKFKNCYTLWAPLQDVNKENGCMYVIPKSHLFFQNYRSSSLETIRLPINENILIKNNCLKILLKAGQAIIFKQALFHGSFPNKSNRNRLVLTCILKSRPTPLYYFHKLNNQQVIRYEFNKELFTTNLVELTKNHIPNTYTKKNEIDYIHNVVTKEQLLEKLTNDNEFN